jgi:protoporphyrinogen oxidase
LDLIITSSSESKSTQSVVVLGGGLSGLAVAYTLAQEGWRDITVLERSAEAGGLAGSFEREGHDYPLGYHHILERDTPLLYFLNQMDALPDVLWRQIKMYFRVAGENFDLGHPIDFLRFPMSFIDKLFFARLMLKAFSKSDWEDWHDKSAADLVEHYASKGVRETIFEPLTQLKFSMPASEVSGAWMGARLHFREGSTPFGYVPNANWTKVLCDGMVRLIEEAGVKVRTRASISKIITEGDQITEVELSDGERVTGDLFVSTIPTTHYCRMLPEDNTPHLRELEYTALISVICATDQVIDPDFYWMNLCELKHTACGIFKLDSLNPEIGKPDDSCINFVTHLKSRDTDIFSMSDEELTKAYSDDFKDIFGFELKARWFNIARVAEYSPILYKSFQNPPAQSARFKNVYFAGNYRSFPSIVSTGSALASGVDTGRVILEHNGQTTTLPESIRQFKPKSKPRA